MITINILINGNVIHSRSARNIEDENDYGKGTQKYKVDTGKIIKHKFEDGVVVLAKKLLNTIEEV